LRDGSLDPVIGFFPWKGPAVIAGFFVCGPMRGLILFRTAVDEE
jgi:hypothetical protein